MAYRWAFNARTGKLHYTESLDWTAVCNSRVALTNEPQGQPDEPVVMCAKCWAMWRRMRDPNRPKVDCGKLLELRACG